MVQSKTQSAGTHVLLIDDDPSLQSLVSTMLGRAGIQTTGAGTGMQGRQLLNEGDFQLLILDLMLPDMDGLEFLKMLRQESRFDDLPVLVLSSKVDPEAFSKALNLGADGYLTKPYLNQNLNQRVIALLTLRRRQPPPSVSFQKM